MTAFCNDLERQLVSALRSAGRSMCAQELGAVLHLNPRRVRSICAHLRSDHRAPICSSSTEDKGYSWPSSAEAVARAVAHMRSRIHEIEAAAKGLELAGEEYFGDAATGQLALGGMP